MAREVTPIDISDLATVQDLSRVVDEVTRTRQPRMLRRADKDVAVLSPVTPATKKQRARGRVLTENDPLFGLIGLGDSGIDGGISGKKHAALGRLRHT